MARPRMKIAPTIEREIAARTARGESAETIAAVVPGAPSVATIKRRQQELHAGRSSSPSPVPAARAAIIESVEDVPGDVPEGTPLEQIDRWIKRCEEGASTAEKQGNLAAMASLAAKAAQLLTIRHRQQPLPKPDPNENPDFKELAKLGRERLATLANGIFAG